MTKTIDYPRIHLSIDNCFAIKRWVRPKDWMQVIKEIGGIQYIEASTDNEIDPLFTTPSYRSKWIEEVKEREKGLGLKVVSFYSGYATYRTTGLAHWNGSNRNKLINQYFKPVVDLAASLGAQVGNSLGAFSAPVLNDPKSYRKTERILLDKLISMTNYAKQKSVAFSYEQMYTPNQGFWTIDGCMNYMKRIYETCAYPMYITIDTAHQCGQRLFLRPGDQDILNMVADRDMGGFRPVDAIFGMVREGCDVSDIKKAIERHSYLFASPEDADVYSWFAETGCYSPIVHLQQTDGTFSGHKPFTAEHNARGIIEPEKVLHAIASSYEKADSEQMMPKVRDIYLTLEVFFGITDADRKIRNDLSESVSYWRRAVPEDGKFLNELL